MVEAAGEFAINKNPNLLIEFYKTEQVPEKMKESEFVDIHKKNGAVESSKLRRISVMSLLKFIGERLETKSAGDSG